MPRLAAVIAALALVPASGAMAQTAAQLCAIAHQRGNETFVREHCKPQSAAPARTQNPSDTTATAAPSPEVVAPPINTVAALGSEPATCWRYENAAWTKLPSDLTASDCLRSLFGGQCERSRTQASYGRWGERTLRLTGGAVEMSDDNRNFTILVRPWPACG